MHLEAPWHQRRATYGHYRRYRLLSELHELTNAWVDEIQAERPAHTIGRGLSRDITENLWMLGSFGKGDLESLLDDTSPEDVLDRIERTVWAVQAYTLNRLKEKTSGSEKAILDSVLEQIAWRLGRQSAERNWARLISPPLGMPIDESQADVRRLVLTLGDTIFASPFLVTRAVANEAQIELLSCPHQSLYNEVRGVADALCGIHSQWVRGFAYGLNPRIVMETTREGERCRHRWTLGTHAPQLPA